MTETRPSLPSHTRLITVALILSLVVHFIMLLVVERIPIHGIGINVEDVINKLAAARDLFPPVRVEPLPDDFYRPLDRPATDDTPPRPVDITRDAIAEWIRAAVPLPELPDVAGAPDLPQPNTNPALSAPDAVAPEAMPVFARQEVVTILDRSINESLGVTPRRELPQIPRVSRAPLDFAPPSFPIPDLPQTLPAAPAETIGNNFHIAQLRPSVELITQPSVGTTPAQPANVATYTVKDPVLDIPLPTRFTPLDDRLSAGIQTFQAPDGHLYFHVALKPRAPDVLPVQPRDVLLVQDCSTSISDSRLQFCKRALADALATLAPNDRFNVMAFNNNVTTAFPAWQCVEPATLERARKFIGNLRAAGSTDFFAALQKTLDFPRDPSRPVIVILVTDGQPTAGLTGSTPIIGEFTRRNAGGVSLFAFGTHGVANAYLLDLLTHSNRGAMEIARGTRWDLPQAVAPFVAGLSSPLMHAMTANFTESSGSEVYPSQLPNLFADRALDLHGRCPPGTREVVMQLRGSAAESAYDAVFRLSLDNAENGPPGLRERWAQLKMYDLIASYAREPSPAIFENLKQLSDEYGVPMFYEREMNK